MTYEDFISYLLHPEELTEAQIPELKELIDKFPYFGMGHLLYLKTLKNSNSIFFNSELNKTAVYVPNRRNLYFFIHPDELETKNHRERLYTDGSYFDMIEKIEKDENENPNSLKSIAEKLKASRQSYTLGNRKL